MGRPSGPRTRDLGCDRKGVRDRRRTTGADGPLAGWLGLLADRQRARGALEAAAAVLVLARQRTQRFAERGALLEALRPALAAATQVADRLSRLEARRQGLETAEAQQAVAAHQGAPLELHATFDGGDGATDAEESDCTAIALSRAPQSQVEPAEVDLNEVK